MSEVNEQRCSTLCFDDQTNLFLQACQDYGESLFWPHPLQYVESGSIGMDRAVEDTVYPVHLMEECKDERQGQARA